MLQVILILKIKLIKNRRSHTIAKGNEICDFIFFRKGKCPFDASKNK